MLMEVAETQHSATETYVCFMFRHEYCTVQSSLSISIMYFPFHVMIRVQHNFYLLTKPASENGYLTILSQSLICRTSSHFLRCNKTKLEIRLQKRDGNKQQRNSVDITQSRYLMQCLVRLLELDYQKGASFLVSSLAFLHVF